MKRILHVMSNISVASGVSSMVMNYYRNIDREKIQFDFLVAKKTINSYDTEIKQLGGRIYYSGNPLALKTIYSSNRYFKYFFKNNIDKYIAVHLHSPNYNEMTLRHAKKYGAKNIIVHSHSSLFSTNALKESINHILVRNITKYADIFFACSHEAASFLYGDKFIKNNKIHIINNAIDYSIYKFDKKKREDVRANLGLNNSLVIGHVSNFSYLKNLSFLVPVIQKTVKDSKEIRFLFIGDGPSKKDLFELLKQKQLDKYCIFIGFTEDVSKYLNAADMIVLPSIKEGLGICLVEAQANGLDCLASENVPEEVDIGYVEFLPLDIESWYNNIKGRNIESINDRIRKSINFRKSKFDIENEALKLEKFYTSLS